MSIKPSRSYLFHLVIRCTVTFCVSLIPEQPSKLLEPGTKKQEGKKQAEGTRKEDKNMRTRKKPCEGGNGGARAEIERTKIRDRILHVAPFAPPVIEQPEVTTVHAAPRDIPRPFEGHASKRGDISRAFYTVTYFLISVRKHRQLNS